jgi:hypothetical protein
MRIWNINYVYNIQDVPKWLERFQAAITALKIHAGMCFHMERSSSYSAFDRMRNIPPPSLSLGPWRYKEEWRLRSRKRFVCCSLRIMNQLFFPVDNFRVIPDLPTALGIGISCLRQRDLFKGESAKRPLVSEDIVERVRQFFFAVRRNLCAMLVVDISTMTVWRCCERDWKWSPIVLTWCSFFGQFGTRWRKDCLTPSTLSSDASGPPALFPLQSTSFSETADTKAYCCWQLENHSEIVTGRTAEQKQLIHAWQIAVNKTHSALESPFIFVKSLTEREREGGSSVAHEIKTSIPAVSFHLGNILLCAFPKPFWPHETLQSFWYTLYYVIFVV